MKRVLAVVGLLGVAVVIIVLARRGPSVQRAPEQLEPPTEAEGPFQRGTFLLYREGEEAGRVDFTLARGVGSTIEAEGDFEIRFSPSTPVTVRGRSNLVVEEDTYLPLHFEGVTVTEPSGEAAPESVGVSVRFHSGMADLTTKRAGETKAESISMQPGFVVLENFSLQTFVLAAQYFQSLAMTAFHSAAFYPSSAELGNLDFHWGDNENLAVMGDTLSCRTILLNVTAQGRVQQFKIWIAVKGRVVKILNQSQGLEARIENLELVSERIEPATPPAPFAWSLPSRNRANPLRE
jgi:hypothetical protein